MDVPIATYMVETGQRLVSVATSGFVRLSGLLSLLQRQKLNGMRQAIPRLSLEECYPSHDSYVKKVEREAEKLVHQRFLEEYAQKIVDAAAASAIGKP